MNSDSPNSACPTNERLEELCLGSLPESQETLLIMHLDECVTCRERLDAVGRSSNALKLATITTDTPIDLSPRLKEAMRELKSLSDSAKPKSDPQFADLAAWFEPSDTGLGRIAHYVLHQCIGQGGMGIVFRAYDTQLRRDVAIKLMSPSLLADPQAAERFLREARSAAGVNHPNVVTVHAVDQARDLPYLVMEYVHGESLDQRLGRLGRLPTDHVIEIAEQVAAGLSAAHESGVIHRDIKPANILIESATGNVKLTDFGLARGNDATSLTQSGIFLGTPEFIAPEQFDSPSGGVDHRADLFSLGSVLYCMCAGRVPFGGQSVLAKIKSVCSTTPDPVESINAKTPKWLASLIGQLHEKNPDQRIQSARDVLQIIQRRKFDGTPFVSDSPETFEQPASRRGRIAEENPERSRRKWSAVLIASSLLIGAFAWIAFGRSNTPKGLAATASELAQLITEKELGEITLTSNGPYQLPALRIENRAVSIHAADGVRPVLLFNPAGEHASIHVVDGELTLDGIEIRSTNSNTGGEEGLNYSIVSCDGSKFVAKNSRFTITGSGSCIEIEGAERSEIAGCELISGAEAGITWLPANGNQLRLSNTFLLCETGIVVEEAGAAELILQRCTFVGESLASLRVNEQWRGQVAIQSTGNLLDTYEAMLVAIVADLDVDEVEPAEFLRWKGEKNLLPKNAIAFLAEEDDEILLSWVQQEWQKEDQIAETDSVTRTPKWLLSRDAAISRLRAGQLKASDLVPSQGDFGATRQ